MRRIHGKRCQYGKNQPPVYLGKAFLLVKGQIIPFHDNDVLILQSGHQLVTEAGSMLFLELVGLFADLMQLPARAHAAGAGDCDTRVDAAFKPRHTHHKEFIEIAGKDRLKICALKQRQCWILCQLQNTFIEFQPADLTVKKPVFGQAPVLRSQSSIFLRLFDFCNMLRDLAAEDFFTGSRKLL